MASKKTAGMTKALLLVDTVINGELKKCNTVIEADAATIEQLVDGGSADASAAAVTYAESQK